MIVHVVALMTNLVVNVQHFGEDRPRRVSTNDRPRREGGLVTVHNVLCESKT